jgi:hypothetical protein
VTILKDLERLGLRTLDLLKSVVALAFDDFEGLGFGTLDDFEGLCFRAFGNPKRFSFHALDDLERLSFVDSDWDGKRLGDQEHAREGNDGSMHIWRRGFGGCFVCCRILKIF